MSLTADWRWQERVSGLEHGSIESMQSEEQRGKNWRKVNRVSETSKQSNIHEIEALEGQERENG